MKVLFICILALCVSLSFGEFNQTEKRASLKRGYGLVAVARDTRTDLFARADNGYIYHSTSATSQDNTFSTWAQLGTVGFVSAPAAVSWGPNRLDVFAVDAFSRLRHKYFDGTQWLPTGNSWNDMGDGGYFLDSTVRVTSSAVGVLDVFVIDHQYKIQHRHYSISGGWTSFTAVTTADTPTSAPIPVSWSSGRVDIFFECTGKICQNTYSAGAWNTGIAVPQDIKLITTPSVTLWESLNRIDLFALDPNSNARHKVSVSGAWVPAGDFTENLGGFHMSEMVATSWANNRIDIFAMGSDSGLWTRTYEQGVWGPYVNLEGSQLKAAPAAATGTVGRLAVYVIGGDGIVYYRIYNSAAGVWTNYGIVPAGPIRFSA